LIAMQRCNTKNEHAVFREITMENQTLTTEQMTDNLYLAMEEIFLQGMVINRRDLVQCHASVSPHCKGFDFHVMPANTLYNEEVELPERLATIRINLDFYDWFAVERCREEYQARMVEIETFIRYLDHLIACNKRIEAEIKKVVA